MITPRAYFYGQTLNFSRIIHRYFQENIKKILFILNWFNLYFSSYTANLAAFLTVDKMITPIENAEDLG